MDIHPTFISIIIKGKLLRLSLPCEVKVDGSKCQRSKVTGSLVVIMPKVYTRDIYKNKGDVITVKPTRVTSNRSNKDNNLSINNDDHIQFRQKWFQKKLSLHELMIIDAADNQVID